MCGIGRKVGKSVGTKPSERNWSAKWNKFIEPTSLGLPNWKVASLFPLAFFVFFGILTACEISGSSTGTYWWTFGTGLDPNLIAGIPRPIRSDEWLVQQSWVVSQYYQGFPSLNGKFPGGFDVTILNNLPSHDWSVAFRPDLWGYLAFGLNVGLAWQWWTPAIILLSGVYLLVVTVLPRRPMLALGIAISVYFTPFVQWWGASVWSVGIPLLILAGMLWTIKERRLLPRLAWAVAMGYFAITLGMTLYVPFIYPSALVVTLITLGFLAEYISQNKPGFKIILVRIIPAISAIVAAGIILVLYLKTRQSTIDTFLNTTYPGERHSATGSLGLIDPFFTNLMGAPWAEALLFHQTEGLGANSSEASTVILMAVFLFPVIFAWALSSLRKGRETNWPLVAYSVAMLLIILYLIVPGWDELASWLFLDRIPPERFRIVFVVLFPVSLVLTIREIGRHSRRVFLTASVASLFAAGSSIYITWLNLNMQNSPVLVVAHFWLLNVVLILTACTLIYFRKTVGIAVAALMIAVLFTGIAINPIYQGLFDLTKTSVGKEVSKINSLRPGNWISAGSIAMAVITESQVKAFSGVQTYPSENLWGKIDPDKFFENNWNRLGHIHWILEPGEFSVNNPSPDVITVIADPCSGMVQKNIQYALSESAFEPSPCLKLVDIITTGPGESTFALPEKFQKPSSFYFYEIVSFK